MYNPNTFYLKLKQHTVTVVKAVEDALGYIKMYIAGVSVKIEKGYFKYVEESHSTAEQGLEQFTVLLNLKVNFIIIKRLEIGFCFKI